MVCVPCFIIPLLLYIWHKFIQPVILRYWNPWEKKDADGKVIKAGPEFPFECKGGACPFVPGAGNKSKVNAEQSTEDTKDEPQPVQKATSIETTALDESKKQI